MDKHDSIEDAVEEALLPFKEYGWGSKEPEGFESRFCEWVDRTPEYQQEYEEQSILSFAFSFIHREIFQRVDAIMGSDLGAEDRESFYRAIDAFENQRKSEVGWSTSQPSWETREKAVKSLSEKYSERLGSIFVKDVFDTLEQWVEFYHSATPSNDCPTKYGYYSNPRSKWDWYSIGGRWRGGFRVREGVLSQANVLGEPGMGEILKAEKGTHQQYESLDVDIARKDQMDWEQMEKKAYDAAARDYQVYRAFWDQRCPHNFKYTVPGTEDVWCDFSLVNKASQLGLFDSEASGPLSGASEFLAHVQAYEASHALDAAARVHCIDELTIVNDERAVRFFWRDEQWFAQVFHACPINAEQWWARFSWGYPLIPSYAVLTPEGEWMAPGEMGWWGMSSDTCQERAQTSKRKVQFFRELPDDTWLVNVDCHI